MQIEEGFSIRNTKIYIYNLKFDDVLVVVPEKYQIHRNDTN